MEEFKRESISTINFTQKNLLIVGNSGYGKSSTVNTLLGINHCVVGHTGKSETKTTSFYDGDLYGYPIRLIDTPGFNDTDIEITDQKILAKIQLAILEHCQTTKQIDGIICVQAMGADRNYLEKTLEYMENSFGKEIKDSILVILTKGEESLLMLLKKMGKYMKKNNIKVKQLDKAIKTKEHFENIYNLITESRYNIDLQRTLEVIQKKGVKFYIPFWSNKYEDFEFVLDKLDLFAEVTKLMYGYSDEEKDLYFEDLQSKYKYRSEETHFKFLRDMFAAYISKSQPFRNSKILEYSDRIHNWAEKIFIKTNNLIKSEYDQYVQTQSVKMEMPQEEFDRYLSYKQEQLEDSEIKRTCVKGILGSTVSTIVTFINPLIGVAITTVGIAGLIAKYKRDSSLKREDLLRELEKSYYYEDKDLTFSAKIVEILKVESTGDGFNDISRECLSQEKPDILSFKMGILRRRSSSYQVDVTALLDGYQDSMLRLENLNKQDFLIVLKERIKEALDLRVFSQNDDLGVVIDEVGRMMMDECQNDNIV